MQPREMTRQKRLLDTRLGSAVAGTMFFVLALCAAPTSAQVVGDDPEKKPVLLERIPDQVALEEESFELDLTVYFSDPDGDPLTYSASGLPDSLNLSPDGLLSGTPDDDDVGNYSIRVTVRDPSNGSARDRFRLEVVQVDDAPIITGQRVIPMVVNEDEVLVITESDLVIVDPDSDLGAMTVDILPGENYSVSGRNNLRPDPNYSGDISAPVTVTADGETSNIFNVFVQVQPVNDAPFVSSPILDQVAAEDANFALNVAQNFDDIEGDALTFGATGLPLSLSISPQGDISGVPGNDDVGEHVITVTATDSSDATGSDVFVLEVTNTNDPPEILTPLGDRSANENTALTIDVSGNFTDPDGDPLTFTATGLPPTLAISPAGLISGTPLSSDLGTHPITITATDPSSATIADNFVLTILEINDPPTVVTPIDDQQVEEDSAFDLDVSSNFDDPDGDVLSFSSTGLPASLTITPSGVISGSPTQEDVGTYTVTITATDPSDEFATDEFILTVVNTNDPPNLVVEIPDQTTDEDSPFQFQLQDFFADPDGDALSIAATGLPDSLVVDQAGTIIGTPGQADVGTYVVTATAADPAGQEVADQFGLTIRNVNDPPVVVAPIGERAALQDIEFVLDVSPFFDDEDGDTLSFEAEGLPPSLSISSDGVISGIPGQDDVGDYRVSVRVEDPLGESVAQTFDLRVDDVNDPPFVSSPIVDRTLPEDTPLSFDVSGSFDDPDGDNLVFAADGLPPSLTIDQDGSISGLPDQQDVGEHVVTVTAEDPFGSSISDDFRLTITNRNDPPVVVAEIGEISAAQNAEFLFDASPYFSDPDEDPLSFLADGLPTSLAMDSGGAISGQPDQSEIGQYAVTVEASDPEGESAQQSFTLIVTDVNDPPLLVLPIGDQFADEDQPFVLDVTPNFDDPDGDPLTYSATGLPPTITISPQGLVSGTPSQSDVGSYNVIVTATDPSQADVSSPFSLTVSGVNDPPVLVGPIGDQVASEDEGFLLDVADRFSDPDGDPLTFEANGLPGSLQISGDGVIVGTPTQSEVGDYQVTVIAMDPAGTQASDGFTLTVQASNDTPLLDEEIPDQQAIEGESFLFDVSGFFSDPDNDELRFSATGLPESGNLEIDELSGVISGTPSLDDTRDFPYEVTINARDPDEATVAGGFQLTVAALDRANASIDISVTPSPALLDDETRWTFSAGNSGPDSIENLRLEGNFIGQQLTINAIAPSNCVVSVSTASSTSFECSLGRIENGGTAFAVFAVTSISAGDIMAEATVGADGSLPVDPNPANNVDQQSVSVAESFSNGSVQQLGESNVRSLAAGDMDGDGDLDLVLGTAAGQMIEVYFSSGYRTFIEDPLQVADNASNDGIGLGDIDGDGDIDMIVANTGNQPNRVFANDGNGNFQLTAEIDGPDSRDVVVVDINGDGFLDIVFATVGENAIYLGDGNGGFALSAQLGNASSHAVQAADLDGDGLPELIFANVGAPSRIWSNQATAPFQTSTALTIGDAVSVATIDVDNDGDTDLAFGRIPSQVGDVAANPVLLNDGSGSMQVNSQLGLAATYQVLAGDIDGDGYQDLVFVSATGTHQVWQGSETGFDLNGMQIEQASAVTGVLNDLGNDDGMDLALGGGALAGASLYLNDGEGNLGMGDAVPPTITLIGDQVVRVPAGSPFIDPGATAEDNIDGDLSNAVRKSGAVNTQVVGDYNIVYSVSDTAGNEANPTVRKVTVVPAAGTGGGGGGAMGPAAILGIILLLAMGNRRFRPS